MVVEARPVTSSPDDMAMKVFTKAIDLLGGPRKLIEHRNLTWLPSLMEASYVVVYSREHGYDAERIASLLGITRQSVYNIMRADEEELKKRLTEAAGEKDEERRTHIAGALAKLAYQEVKKEG